MNRSCANKWRSDHNSSCVLPEEGLSPQGSESRGEQKIFPAVFVDGPSDGPGLLAEGGARKCTAAEEQQACNARTTCKLEKGEHKGVCSPDDKRSKGGVNVTSMGCMNGQIRKLGCSPSFWMPPQQLRASGDRGQLLLVGGFAAPKKPASAPAPAPTPAQEEERCKLALKQCDAECPVDHRGHMDIMSTHCFNKCMLRMGCPARPKNGK